MSTKFDAMRYRLAAEQILNNKSIIALALKQMDAEVFSYMSTEEIEDCFSKGFNKKLERRMRASFNRNPPPKIKVEDRTPGVHQADKHDLYNYTLVTPNSKKVVKVLVEVIPEFIENPIEAVFPKAVINVMQEYTKLISRDLPLYQMSGFEFDKLYTLVFNLNTVNERSNNLYQASIINENCVGGVGQKSIIPEDQFPIPLYLYSLGHPDSAKTDFMKLLDIIFKSDLSAEERVQTLRHEFGISLSDDDVEAIMVLVELGDNGVVNSDWN